MAGLLPEVDNPDTTQGQMDFKWYFLQASMRTRYDVSEKEQRGELIYFKNPFSAYIMRRARDCRSWDGGTASCH
jgi:hypothetical protein